tara:strand:+ start:9576 stop:10256 length:681 start_codon:yes stop_codon:yes gene_type:complete
MTSFKPSKLEVNFEKFIGIFDNAFTLKECEDVINLFEICHKRGYTYTRSMQGIDLNKQDDTSVSFYPSIDLDLNPDFVELFHNRFYEYIYPFYNNQYPAIQKLSKHKSRHIKIQKTEPTQGYHVWHSEHDAPLNARDRVLSWILYLNDVEEGGETEFLYQSLRFKPKTGTFILFPAYFTHTHRGNPPLSGVKYIATGWIEFMNTSDNQGKSILPNLKENIKSVNYS